MTYFEPAKELHDHDLEINMLLRRALEAEYENTKNRGFLFPPGRVLLIAVFGLPLYFLKQHPEFGIKLLKFAKRYKSHFPLWIKKLVKILLDIIPNESGQQTIRTIDLSVNHPIVLQKGFGLPTSNQPEVSIIIPVHNHIQVTLRLLQQLRMNLDETKYEVILVDDASTDMTKPILSNIRGVKLLTHELNLGYLKATNSAIQYCEGKFICLLNNDTVPESGWLDALTRTLKADPRIAIAGSMLLSDDGTVAEAGSQIFRNREIWNLGRSANKENKLFSFTREVDYCSAAAVLVDGDFFRSLGGFDARYSPAYYEDVDLAISAWNQNRKVVYVHDSRVHHIEGVSHGKDVSQGLKAFQRINQIKFWEKWEKSIDLPWLLDEIPRFEADRDSEGIIVFFDNSVPSKNSNAGATRAFNLIEGMRHLGYHVVLIPLESAREVWEREQLQRLGVEVYTSYSEAIDNLEMRVNRIKGIWISRIDVFEVVIDKIQAKFPDKPIFFDTVDLHHLRDERNIKIHGLDAAIYGKDIKVKELNACVRADSVIVVSDFEREYLMNEIPSLKIHTLFMPQASLKEDVTVVKGGYILFVGNFSHTPNVDAADWLVSEIFSKIPQTEGDPIKLKIVGQGLSGPILGKIDGEAIQYLGWQNSLDNLYADARMVVVPLRYGAGKKGKLSEAVSRNCPVVSTTIGVEGFPLEDGVDCVIADTTEDFVKGILRLWHDSDFAARVSKNANLKLNRENSFENFVELLGEVLQRREN